MSICIFVVLGNWTRSLFSRGSIRATVLAIAKGLTIDCLSYEAAIAREFPNKN